MKADKVEIFNNAKSLFEKNGFKDTAVADITKMSGIAVGSFYNMYSSKEEVFVEVFIAEAERVKRSITSGINLDADPVLVIKELTLKLFEEIKRNSILREWYNIDVFNKIKNYINTEDELEIQQEYANDFFTDIIRKWQQEGKFRADIDSDMILAIFNSFQYIEMHKNEIGSPYFPEALEYIIEFVVKGLRK